MNADRKARLIIGIGIPAMVSLFLIVISMGRYQISADAMVSM